MTIACAPAPAAVLYNSGPSATDPYNVIAYTISDPYAVANSFTLGGPATITGINFAAWISEETLQSVDWAITTSPFGGLTLASGTATSFTSTGVPPPSGLGFWIVTTEEFSIAALAVAGGTYWLQLGHALATNEGTPVFWDQADPSGSGQQTESGVLLPDSPGTQTFQILGSREVAETPLPAALPLFATGLGALGLLGWRRKRKAQAVA